MVLKPALSQKGKSRAGVAPGQSSAAPGLALSPPGDELENKVRDIWQQEIESCDSVTKICIRIFPPIKESEFGECVLVHLNYPSLEYWYNGVDEYPVSGRRCSRFYVVMSTAARANQVVKELNGSYFEKPAATTPRSASGDSADVEQHDLESGDGSSPTVYHHIWATIALNQKVLHGIRKPDRLCNTLHSLPEFQAFVERLEKAKKEPKIGGMQVVQETLAGIEAKEKERELMSKVSTPLVEFIAEKQKARAEGRASGRDRDEDKGKWHRHHAEGDGGYVSGKRFDARKSFPKDGDGERNRWNSGKGRTRREERDGAWGTKKVGERRFESKKSFQGEGGAGGRAFRRQEEGKGAAEKEEVDEKWAVKKGGREDRSQGEEGSGEWRKKQGGVKDRGGGGWDEGRRKREEGRWGKEGRYKKEDKSGRFAKDWPSEKEKRSETEKDAKESAEEQSEKVEGEERGRTEAQAVKSATANKARVPTPPMAEKEERVGPSSKKIPADRGNRRREDEGGRGVKKREEEGEYGGRRWKGDRNGSWEGYGWKKEFAGGRYPEPRRREERAVESKPDAAEGASLDPKDEGRPEVKRGGSGEDKQSRSTANKFRPSIQIYRPPPRRAMEEKGDEGAVSPEGPPPQRPPLLSDPIKEKPKNTNRRRYSEQRFKPGAGDCGDAQLQKTRTFRATKN